MCGRYSLVCIDDLGNRFRVFNPMMGARSRFNIAPGNEMPVIVGGETRELVLMQWGLLPHWPRSSRKAPRPINIRAETLSEKSSFGVLLQERRCLVPASGFYEWKKEGKRNIPFYFYLSETPLFAFAGLYDQWAGPDGTVIPTYSILTCEPNPGIAKIHNRMPVILSRAGEDRWLSPDPLPEMETTAMFVPFTAEKMTWYPVLPLVNSPGIDDERLIRPVHSFTGTQTLLEE
nr:SOS response-associated peptidase [uncultured Methanoregula sp.]